MKRSVFEEPGRPTNVEVSLQYLKANNPSLHEVNLNNTKNIPVPTLKESGKALETKTHAKKTIVTFAFVDMLKVSKTSMCTQF